MHFSFQKAVWMRMKPRFHPYPIVFQPFTGLWRREGGLVNNSGVGVSACFVSTHRKPCFHPLEAVFPPIGSNLSTWWIGEPRWGYLSSNQSSNLSPWLGKVKKRPFHRSQIILCSFVKSSSHHNHRVGSLIHFYEEYIVVTRKMYGDQIIV